MSIFIERGKTLLEKIKNLIWFNMDIQLKDILSDMTSQLNSTIPEAPEDGETYGRKDGEWVEVEGGGSEVNLDDITFQRAMNNLPGQVGGGILTSLDSNSYGGIAFQVQNGVSQAGFLGKLGNLESRVGISLGGLNLLETYIDGSASYSSRVIFETPIAENSGALIKIPALSEGEYTFATTDDIPSATINIIDSGNYIIPNGTKTRMITLTDDTAQTVTLPAIEDSVGSIYFITNASSDGISSVNVFSKTGSNDIWDSGLLVNDKEVIYGAPVRIINDGLNYKIL